MNTPITQLREKLDRRKGQRDIIEEQIENTKKRIRVVRRNLHADQKAREVLQIVAKKTQEQIEYQLSDLGSAAMSAIFTDPYKLMFDFQMRRNKVEADLLYLRGEKAKNPKRTGGGAQDIGSLATRFSTWAISIPRTRGIFFLDEPLKWLKGHELPRRGAALIKELSEKLGIQIIMVSHDPDLIDSADQIINVEMVRKVSKIK